MWHFGDGMGWWMVFGSLWMLLFWGAIIGLVAWAIVRLTRKGDSSRDTGERSALDIARERYARGEITRDEFQQIKKDLTQR